MIKKAKVWLKRWFYCISTSFHFNAMSNGKRQITKYKHDKQLNFHQCQYFRDCFVQMQRVVRWPALSSPWRWRPPPPPPCTPTWPPPTLPTSRPPPARPPPTSLSCQSRASLSHPTTILISAGKYWHQNLPSRLSVSSSKIFEGDVLFSDLNLIFLFLLEGIAHFEMELKSDATKLENNSKKFSNPFNNKSSLWPHKWDVAYVPPKNFGLLLTALSRIMAAAW